MLQKIVLVNLFYISNFESTFIILSDDEPLVSTNKQIDDEKSYQNSFELRNDETIHIINLIYIIK